MSLIQRFKRVPYFFQFAYEKVTTSIAFFPSLMALGFFLLTGLMIYLEQLGLSSWLGDWLPTFLLIKSWEVAQSILATLVGALITLMVFSFSMVMVLLNNAASNFSPRILPGLIADKFHQFVLGFYLGTIIYCLLFGINMSPSQADIPIPAISVLLGIFLGLSCLMLFIFFIHSISVSVQVGKILASLKNLTLSNMRKDTILAFTDEPLPGDIDAWPAYKSDRSGHLKYIDVKDLRNHCEVNEIRIRVLIPTSLFVPEGIDLFVCDKVLEDDLRNKIFTSFVFSNDEYAAEDHVIGFKQITEIAVKAMSPGINDPGTAITAIDYLTVLFMEKMKMSEIGGILEKETEGNTPATKLWLTLVTFDELLVFVLAPLRQYARHDLVVVLKLMGMLKFLASRLHCQPRQLQIIWREADILLADAEKYLTNVADFARVKLVRDLIVGKEAFY